MVTPRQPDGDLAIDEVLRMVLGAGRDFSHWEWQELQ